MNIEDVLREIRAGLLPKKVWADVIVAEMQEKNAKNKRLEVLVEESYKEGWQDALHLPYNRSVELDTDWTYSKALATLTGKE